MTHRIRSRLRTASIGMALALAVAACGDAAAPLDAGTPLLAPTPIHVSGTGSPGGAAAAGGLAASPEGAAAAVAVDRMGMMAPWAIFDYIVGPTMPALPTQSSGWHYPAGATADLNRVAQIAATLGIAGDPVALPADRGGGWIIGPEDGSAPALWVTADSQLGWWFNSAYPMVAYASGGCAPSIAVDPGDGTDAAPGGTDTSGTALPDECVFEEPTPPTGILTADQARARATDLLAQMGEDPAAFELEVYADEWYASVSARQRLGTVTSPVAWYFGFGTDGRLEYAGGVLAQPAEVGPYPLVDLDTAVARLSDGYFGGIGIMADDTVSLGAPDQACTEALDCPQPPTEPEHIQVTLSDVVPDLWWAWDSDGTVWLLPAYTFLDADGGRYTVPAVTDEYLLMDAVIVDPAIDEPAPPPGEDPIAGNPGVVAPGVVEPGVVEPGVVEPGVVISDADAAALVGLSEEAALASAAERGWAARVVVRDGERFAVTEDYSDSRVNLTIDGGIVTTVTVG